MESPTDLKPKISILVPAMLGYDSVLAALDSWEAQSCRDRLELLVLCPSRPDHPIPKGQTIVETGAQLLHEARATGVRAASADFVMFAEDHCLPDPECAERLIERMKEPWDAVGTALRSGNPQWAVTQGSFLISYGEWMLPEAGTPSFLPGHNVALRRQVLLDMGSELIDELLFASFLMRRLRSEGRTFFVEPSAKMRHFDPPSWKRAARIFFTIGTGCGAIRLRNSAIWAQALFTLIIPLTMARHFGRGLVHYFRAGPRAGFGFESVIASGILASIWALGEVVGAWRGIDAVTPSLWTSEVKPISRENAAAIP